MTALPNQSDTLALYSKIEGLITERSIYGRGQTEGAAHFRHIVNPQIKRLRTELNRRGLPSRLRDFEANSRYWAICKPQWMRDAECQAEDIADLHNTQEHAI